MRWSERNETLVSSAQNLFNKRAQLNSKTALATAVNSSLRTKSNSCENRDDNVIRKRIL
jgi:hypothetical protein